MSGAKMEHVPYRGAAPAITDMLGNRVQVIFDNMPSIIGHLGPNGLSRAGGDDSDTLTGIARRADGCRDRAGL
jgi:hypothetical protein